MAASSFDRAFSGRDIFRGAARSAILWSVFGAVLLLLLLFDLYFILGLLENEGRLELAAKEVTACSELTGVVVHGQSQSDVGLRPIVWKSAASFWGPALAAVYRNVPWLQTDTAALALLLGVALLIGLSRSLILSRVQHLSSRTAFDVVTQMRRDLHRQALRLGPGDLLNTGGDDVLALFSDDADRIRDTIANRIFRQANNPVEIVVLTGMSLSLDWRVAFQCLIPLGFAWYLFLRAQTRFRAARRLNESRAEADLRVLSEGFEKTRIVRGYGMESLEHEQFQAHLDHYSENAIRIQKGQRWYRWTCRGLMLLCVAVVLFFLGVKTFHPAEATSFSLSTGILLVLCFALTYRPLEELSKLSGERSDASVAADRIYRYLNRIPDVSQAVGAKFLQPVSRSIQFENIHYNLPGRQSVLNGIDLKLTAGKVIAVVSSDPLEALALSYLLPRFIEPHKGRVFLDGEDIAWVTLESLRAETVYVGGTDPLFTGTALENIVCGNKALSLQDATEAAKATHAHQFILKLAQGYETMLGEHGEQLDPGEGFRLGLARAVLRKPALLILDEPKSKLDADTKSLLDDAYNRITRDRTVIFLPSRLSTIKRADQIVLLHRGKVSAVGTHAALVKSSALYRHWEYLHFNEFRAATGEE